MLLRDKRKKESGVLMHISCLPSNYGIGSFGIEAYRFIDFLKSANQKYWQILPLCPIGEGNSPYKSFSTFAGEILFIDLNFLVRDGLLSKEDLPPIQQFLRTDYKTAKEVKLPLLKKAAKNFNINNIEFKRFIKDNEYWLIGYSLFMAIKERYNNIPFYDFPSGLKYRLPFNIESFKGENWEAINFYKITQFLFYKQYFSLKSYAKQNGIKIIGDLPFYVSLDSADVWENPQIFKLNRDMKPIEISGVPPDIFSKDGQLWGNPIYDFPLQKKTNYFWWCKRLLHSLSLYDLLRIDHFRAFADYYAIPFGSETAKNGVWEKGPNMDFWSNIKKYIGNNRIIAEDLGGEKDKNVEQLVKNTNFPNMKVLQFAFNTDLQNIFLPYLYNYNCVCYTGTHDNDTTLGWYDKSSNKERILFSRLVSNNSFENIPFRLIRYAMTSPARLVIIPIQDYLSLGSEYRMNTPGTQKGNWEYRLDISLLNEKLKNEIIYLSRNRNK